MTHPVIDATHEAALGSWVTGADSHPEFPIQNLPLGVFSPKEGARRVGVAIGEWILDLKACANHGLLPEAAASSVKGDTLNALFALPGNARLALRQRVSELLSNESHRASLLSLLTPALDCTLYLPATVGDFSDFYAGIHHAENVGKQFRPDAPLLPNYKYVPIGYHGRASSIRPSGVPLTRPQGQRKLPGADAPMYGPTQKLDYELELGIWVGPGNALGNPIPIGQASDHIAGFCLLNDWSARDLQSWEYQPLGPFLAKSFHTTISPWVITAEALAPFRIPQPPRESQDPRPLPYLWDDTDQRQGAFAVDLSVTLSTARMRLQGYAPLRVSQTTASHLYWTVAQLLTHHASNGCNLNAGDLLGSGTISAPKRGGYGSLLEVTNGGREVIQMPTGETRSFLDDGDEVALHAIAQRPGFVTIGFGPCRAQVRSLT